ncbi:MAG TPA: hypothetical protein VGM74_11565 [Burkholderiaceae bacterium]
MRLRQFHALKVWHGQHGRKPVERNVWDAVLTVWLLGWVGAPTAFLLQLGWAEIACASVLFLPGLYVALRRSLHRRHWLRCDWISALR